MKSNIFIFLIIVALFFSCESALGPNEIGGDTNITLTQVGNEFGFSVAGSFSKAFNNVIDSIIIIKNDNGIITLKGIFVTSRENLKQLDTLFGTHNLPENIKHQFVDYYLDRFDAHIDTSNSDNWLLNFESKLKVTSEGIQDFFHSNGDISKPFTIVKYSSNVGDKYEFTTKEGKKIVREVVQKNPTEDWELVFWRVKTIRVEEKLDDDPLFDKITYIANHKFGLVGIILNKKDGTVISSTVIPWALL